MIGSAVNTPSIDEDLKEEIARKRLYEVSDKYNMGIEDVELEFDSTLPYNILGRTRNEYDGSQKIVVGDSFLESSETEQLKTMAHEGFHVKQFRNEEAQWLEQQFGVSDDFSDQVEKAWRNGKESEIEGITEVVVDNLLPFETDSGYPYEKRSKERELEAKGIDVESELLEDIEQEMYGLVEEFKEVYGSVDTGELYVEAGKVGDIEYLAVSTGYTDPEDSVNEYLSDVLTDLDADYQLPETEYLGERSAV